MANLAERIPIEAVWEFLPIIQRTRIVGSCAPAWVESFDSTAGVQNAVACGWRRMPQPVRQAVINFFVMEGCRLERLRARG